MIKLGAVVLAIVVLLPYCGATRSIAQTPEEPPREQAQDGNADSGWICRVGDTVRDTVEAGGGFAVNLTA